EVTDEAAVGEHIGTGVNGRKRARNRHAGAHGSRQITGPQHDHVALEHVGRNGTVRDRQLVEARDGARLGDVAAQQRLDVRAGNQPGGSDYPAVLEGELQPGTGLRLSALLFGRLEFAVPGTANDRLPVYGTHEPLDVTRARAGRPSTAHDGADARAGNAVDGDMHLFEHLEHADMG